MGIDWSCGLTLFTALYSASAFVQFLIHQMLLVNLLVGDFYHVMCSCNCLQLGYVLFCLVIFLSSVIHFQNGVIDADKMLLKCNAKPLILF